MNTGKINTLAFAMKHDERGMKIYASVVKHDEYEMKTDANEVKQFISKVNIDKMRTCSTEGPYSPTKLLDGLESF